MQELLKIKVTKKDIDAGIIARTQWYNSDFSTDYDCTCPVGRAMTRAMGKIVKVSVYVAEDSDGKRYYLPLKVTHFLRAFDSKRVGEPFEFEIG